MQRVIAQADGSPQFRPRAAWHVDGIAQLAGAVERFAAALVPVSRKGSKRVDKTYKAHNAEPDDENAPRQEHKSYRPHCQQYQSVPANLCQDVAGNFAAICREIHRQGGGVNPRATCCNEGMSRPMGAAARKRSISAAGRRRLSSANNMVMRFDEANGRYSGSCDVP